LLVVDDLPRKSGSGLSHRNLPHREFVADDRTIGFDVNPSGSGLAQFHLSQIFFREDLLLRETAYGGSRETAYGGSRETADSGSRETADSGSRETADSGSRGESEVHL
jgi:hypothetical protein